MLLLSVFFAHFLVNLSVRFCEQLHSELYVFSVGRYRGLPSAAAPSYTPPAVCQGPIYSTSLAALGAACLFQFSCLVGAQRYLMVTVSVFLMTDEAEELLCVCCLYWNHFSSQIVVCLPDVPKCTYL